MKHIKLFENLFDKLENLPDKNKHYEILFFDHSFMHKDTCDELAESLSKFGLYVYNVDNEDDNFIMLISNYEMNKDDIDSIKNDIIY